MADRGCWREAVPPMVRLRDDQIPLSVPSPLFSSPSPRFFLFDLFFPFFFLGMFCFKFRRHRRFAPSALCLRPPFPQKLFRSTGLNLQQLLCAVCVPTLPHHFFPKAICYTLSPAGNGPFFASPPGTPPPCWLARLVFMDTSPLPRGLFTC